MSGPVPRLRGPVARDQARAEFGTLVEHGELAERDAPPHSNSAAQSGIGAVGSDPSEDLRFFGPDSCSAVKPESRERSPPRPPLRCSTGT